MRKWLRGKRPALVRLTSIIGMVAMVQYPLFLVLPPSSWRGPAVLVLSLPLVGLIYRWMYPRGGQEQP